MAATFCDLKTERAIRVMAKESAKERARALYPEIANKNEQQMRAYRDMAPEELFGHEWVRVKLGPEEFPGYKGERRACHQCGEGINFGRHVERDGRTLCRACAGERYYEKL